MHIFIQVVHPKLGSLVLQQIRKSFFNCHIFFKQMFVCLNSGEDLSDYQVHVRQFRQHLSGKTLCQIWVFLSKCQQKLSASSVDALAFLVIFFTPCTVGYDTFGDHIHLGFIEVTMFLLMFLPQQYFESWAETPKSNLIMFKSLHHCEGDWFSFGCTVK